MNVGIACACLLTLGPLMPESVTLVTSLRGSVGNFSDNLLLRHDKTPDQGPGRRRRPWFRAPRHLRFLARFKARRCCRPLAHLRASRLTRLNLVVCYAVLCARLGQRRIFTHTHTNEQKISRFFISSFNSYVHTPLTTFDILEWWGWDQVGLVCVCCDRPLSLSLSFSLSLSISLPLSLFRPVLVGRADSNLS